MKAVWIESVASTNAWLREHWAEIPPLTMVCARRQTSGRGQRGNSWEAEPGKNLTFSYHFRPEGVRPAGQFAVSAAVALSIVDLLEHYGLEAKVKWPNDIYVGNRKICGILIENSIMADTLDRSIVGVGLNVNQLEFRSDAPNPVSMAMLAGREFSLEEVAESLREPDLSRSGDFMRHLWRGDGRLHPYRDAASGEHFLASIAGVEPSGHLLLQPAAGPRRRYAFKEVEALI